MTKTTDAREIALDILMEVVEKDGFSHILLRQALDKYQYLDKRDRSFITRLVEGTLEYLLQLDYILNSFSKIKVSKMKPVIRNILRMSVYQIKYMDSVPDSAACNEAVKLTVKRGLGGLKGFVNGLLRGIVRNMDQIAWPSPDNQVEYLSVRYSMPQWIVSQWLVQYGEDTAKSMLSAALEESRTAVRCNLSRASKEECIKSLNAQGIAAKESEIIPSLLYLSGYDRVETIEAFQKGWIQVQDLGSALDVFLAGPQKGSYVLDVCAAPGGKSLHAADMMEGTGVVDARDLTLQKVQLIADNAARCGFGNVSAKAWDACVLDETLIDKADVVIADLPCSGLGVVGRKNDIKYKMTAEKQSDLAGLQREILAVASRYVKPGGLFIYSTCTTNKAENETNARWLREQYPQFVPVDLEGRLPGLEAESMKQGMLTLLPGIHPSDGFFIAVQKRIEYE